MTHTNTVGDPAVTNAASFLARHAAARVWRHLAEDQETPDAARMVLLERLPGIEADPVGADWEAAADAAWEVDDDHAWDAYAPSSAYAASSGGVGLGDYSATANATRAVGLGCAGSDRIGLALTLLADGVPATRHGPTDAWEIAGMVIEAGHRRSADGPGPEAVEGLPG